MPALTAPIFLVLPDRGERMACFHALTTQAPRIVRGFASAGELNDAAPDMAGGIVLFAWRQPGAAGGADLLAHCAGRGDLLLLVVADRLTLDETRTVLRAGALDILAPPLDPAVLPALIDDAVARWSGVRAAALAQRAASDRLDRLTPRERDILAALAEGLTSKEIARRFDLSPRTIDIHRANIMRRSEARSFAQLLHFHFLTAARPQAMRP